MMKKGSKTYYLEFHKSWLKKNIKISQQSIPWILVNKFKFLLSHGVLPKAILDGRRLPIKGKTHAKRQNPDSTSIELTEKLKLDIIKVSYTQLV